MAETMGETPKPPAVETAAPATPEPTGETPAELKARLETMATALREANKESASRRKRLDELEAAEKSRADAALSETERTAKEAAELKAKVKDLERREMVRSVADKVGLPPALAARLRGETPEEVEADAKALLELIPTKSKASINPTNPSQDGTQSETFEQQHARWKTGGQVVNPFAGGGVVWPHRDIPD